MCGGWGRGRGSATFPAVFFFGLTRCSNAHCPVFIEPHVQFVVSHSSVTWERLFIYVCVCAYTHSMSIHIYTHISIDTHNFQRNVSRNKIYLTQNFVIIEPLKRYKVMFTLGACQVSPQGTANFKECELHFIQSLFTGTIAHNYQPWIS